MLFQRAAALLSLLVHECGASASSSPSDFPTIDLGYARHVPTFVNTTSANNISYATYRNIRFAQPPVDDLRFKAPVTPPPAANGIQDGVVPLSSTNCLQTWPAWFTTPPGMNGSTWGSEDCLFLDVIVPEGLDPASAGKGVPVLHWIYGGGYFSGAKDWSGNPAGLFDGMDPDGKFIIVASNYRLGPLGWMSSKTEPSMTPNAGLYDGWAALQWTRKYVSLFGGDPENVTVMGQSAGAGILQHFLAVDAQGQHVPFNQAILSSPGYRPHVDRATEMTDIYQIFLNATNCTDVSCLRELPEEDMARANAYMMLDAPQGKFGGPSIGPGPVIDGNLVKDLPDRVLANSSQLGQVRRVISGGMKNEGLFYRNYTWPEFVRVFARTPSNHTIETIKGLYGTTDKQPASSPAGMLQPTPLDKFFGDITFKCHTYYSAEHWAKGDGQGCCSTGKSTQAYRYELSIPPAAHGQDISYYFYDKNVAALDPTVVKDVALKFQHYLRRFILGQDMQGWPEYHSEAPETPSWVNLTAGGIETVTGKDESSLSERCSILMELMQKKEDGW